MTKSPSQEEQVVTPTNPPVVPAGPTGIYGKIAHAQATMPNLVRDRHVEVKNREGKTLYAYDYITEDAITKAVREHLATLGVATIASFPDVEEIGDAGGESVVRVRVEVTFADADTGQTAIVHGWGYGTDRGDKAVGKAQTSGFRQLLVKFLLQAGGDDGEATNTDAPRTATADRYAGTGAWSPSEPQVKRLFAIAKNQDWGGLAASDAVKLACRILSRKATPDGLGIHDPNSIPSKQAYEAVAEFLESSTPEKVKAMATMQQRVDEHIMQTEKQPPARQAPPLPSDTGVPIADAIQAQMLTETDPQNDAPAPDDELPF